MQNLYGCANIKVLRISIRIGFRVWFDPWKAQCSWVIFRVIRFTSEETENMHSKLIKNILALSAASLALGGMASNYLRLSPDVPTRERGTINRKSVV